MKPKSASTTTMIRMIQRMLMQLLPWAGYRRETTEAARWLRPEGGEFPRFPYRPTLRTAHFAVREAVVPVARALRDVFEVGVGQCDRVRATAGVSMTRLRAFAATVGPLEGGELDRG
jgi:hypothetical protein